MCIVKKSFNIIEIYENTMKLLKTPLLVGSAFLISTFCIPSFSANATVSNASLKEHMELHQRTIVKTESNGCRRYSDGSIDCRRG